MMNSKNNGNLVASFLYVQSIILMPTLSCSSIPVHVRYYDIDQEAILSYEEDERIATFNEAFGVSIDPYVPFIPVNIYDEVGNKCPELSIHSQHIKMYWNSNMHGFPLLFLQDDHFTVSVTKALYYFKKKDGQSEILKKAERNFLINPLGRYRQEEYYNAPQVINKFLDNEILSQTIWCDRSGYNHGNLGWFEMKKEIHKMEKEELKKAAKQILLYNCLKRVKEYLNNGLLNKDLYVLHSIARDKNN